MVLGPQLFNSFYILFLSLFFSIPLAIGAGVYLAEYAGDNRLTIYNSLKYGKSSDCSLNSTWTVWYDYFCQYIGYGI